MKHPILDQHWSLALCVGLLFVLVIVGMFVDAWLLPSKSAKINTPICIAGRCVQ